MKHSNLSPGDREEHPVTAPIRVWDLPVRLFHWLLAFSFAGAYLTAEAERWRLVHVILGYTMAALVCFRIVWGCIGTSHARFASFVRGPRAIIAYLRSLLSGRPAHFVGHNPAGAIVIVAMLSTTLVVAASGWLLWSGAAGEWMEEVHEVLANLMLALVGIHVAGVAVASWLHRENLAKAMLTGRKRGAPGAQNQAPRTGVALVLLLLVLGLWWWQGSNADLPAGRRAHAEQGADAARGDDD